MGFFEEENGSASCFQLLRRAQHSLQNIKERGVVSHFQAQRRELISWLSDRSNRSRGPRHAVIIRIYDDTNVWVHPQKRRCGLAPGEGEQEEGAGEGEVEDAVEAEAAGPASAQQQSAVGRAGKRKVCPLLGLVQRIFVRLPAVEGEPARMDVAQVHVPAQVLPKANTQTIYTRLQRWAALSCSAQSEQMGGANMDAAWKSVPFKVLATCSLAVVIFWKGSASTLT